MKFKILGSKRRGLSSIVGALLFVVLMVSTFAVLGVALTAQTDIASTGRDVAASDLKKQQEDFRIDVSTDSPIPPNPAELFIAVENNGPNTIEISTVVVAQLTKVLEDYPVDVYDIPPDLSFITPESKQNILPPGLILLDLADPSTTGVGIEQYQIKVISSLGTKKLWTVTCDENGCAELEAPPGSGSLSATMFLDGPNGINTKTSTVVIFGNSMIVKQLKPNLLR